MKNFTCILRTWLMFWRITWQMATLWSFLRPLRYCNLCVCVKVLSFRIESNRIDKNCQRIAWLFRTSHYHIVKTVFYMLCRFRVSLSTLQQLPLYGVSMLWRAEGNERAYVYAKRRCIRERERERERVSKVRGRPSIKTKKEYFVSDTLNAGF